ncbi:urea ABC transporter ATP-binding protein UrtD [Geomicrobium sediminis]|uniref:Urea transport system ATP-binding protein n=1 Tax=Geomicrobium sediminis TaxID=1347788 RepID=A0ABS2PD88_9BACL|nr:urea ABC transporter ATP-binding protein UrtD [Geomicrobium sediminis]MBM7633284.1 urea transport system ATP-binding protein [Geomicrobium sediminis]
MEKIEKKKQSSTTVLQSEKLIVQFGGLKAINEFSFQLSDRELHFIIGPNGAGKTTFLDVLCGKTKPTSGNVLFKESIELGKLYEYQIVRKGVGRKFQAPSIFPSLSVMSNLEIAMKQQKGFWHILRAKLSEGDKEHIHEMLTLIGLKEESNRTAGTLAHGQKQWLEIAMVLMQDPELVLLDEPIAGMTEEEEEKTGELLRTIAKDRAVIVVEHDMDFVRKFADKVTVMHEGTWLCDGSMEEVQQNERVLEVYLGRR